MLYEIVLKFVGEEERDPDKGSREIVLMDVSTASEAKRFMKLWCGRGWTMERRPDLHTFPSNDARLLAITFRRKR